MAKQTKADKAILEAAKALAIAGPIDSVPVPEEEVLANAAKNVRERAIQLSGLNPNEFDAISDDEKIAFVEVAADQLKAESGPAGKLPATPKGDLVRVTKDGVELDVHPSALQQHQNIGWKLVSL